MVLRLGEYLNIPVILVKTAPANHSTNCIFCSIVTLANLLGQNIYNLPPPLTYFRSGGPYNHVQRCFNRLVRKNHICLYMIHIHCLICNLCNKHIMYRIMLNLRWLDYHLQVLFLHR